MLCDQCGEELWRPGAMQDIEAAIDAWRRGDRAEAIFQLDRYFGNEMPGLGQLADYLPEAGKCA